MEHLDSNFNQPFKVVEFYGDNKQCLFECDLGHKFRSVYSTIKHRKKCPICKDIEQLMHKFSRRLDKSLSFVVSEVKYIEKYGVKSRKYTYKTSLVFKVECRYGHVSFYTSMNSNRKLICQVCNHEKFLRAKAEECKKLGEDRNWEFIPPLFSVNEAKFRCDKGHLFTISISDIKRGRHCSVCFRTVKNTLEKAKFLAEKHNGFCLNTKYIDAISPMRWRCEKGHEWVAEYNTIQQGHWCPECSGVKKHIFQDCLDLARQKNWTLLSTEYINIWSMLKWVCDKGHEFSQPFVISNSGHGCPYCQHPRSKAEMEIENYVKEVCGIKNIISNARGVLNRKEIDIYLPDKKIGVEYHGLHWHSYDMLMKSHTKNEALTFHQLKADLADEKGVRLLQIFEDEWTYKQNIIKKILRNVLHASNEKTVYARKCEIKNVLFSEAEIFLNENHFQGAGLVGTIRLGLYYEKVLVSLMTFKQGGKAQNIKKEEGVYDLYKYVTSCKVVGGLQKLLKHFERIVNPKRVYSFVDRRLFTGYSFLKTGFIIISKTVPGYFYFNDKGIREGRYDHRKNDEAKDLGLTEFEYAKLKGYCRIYDAGHLKLEKVY